MNPRHYDSVLELRKEIIRSMVNRGYWEYQGSHQQELVHIPYLIEAIRVLKTGPTSLNWGSTAAFAHAKKCMDVAGDNWIPYLQC